MRFPFIWLFLFCLAPGFPFHATADDAKDDDLIWGTVSGQYRHYYYRQSDRLKSDDSEVVRESLAIGGHVKYETPWMGDVFKAGAAGYASAPFISSLNRPSNGGTSLLTRDNGGILVLGEAYLSGRVDWAEVTAYRHRLETPFVNGNDSRMIPHLFEGVSAAFDPMDDLELQAAWIEKVKLRNTEQFRPMSEASGVDALAGSKRGMVILGGDWKPAPFTGKAWFYAIPDYLQTAFLQAGATHKLDDDLALRWLVQGLDQRSLGSADGGGFSTGQIGGLGGVIFNGFTFEAGAAVVDETVDVEDVWGDYPFFNKMMVFGNNRAGEQALYFNASYDFSRVGWKGFSSAVKASFSTTPDEGAAASADRNEYNLNMRYAFDGDLEGLSLLHRWAFIEQRGDRDTVQVRLRLQYDFSLD